jgi:eukaryotic-like serine/threonine-protein kinase
MPEPLEGIADYRFLRSLGQANHGEFFLASPPARLGLLDAYVTVKVVDGPTPADTFRRATRELRAFAVVICPQLVTIHDAGQDGDRFYYAMEHTDLGSLGRPAQALQRAQVLTAVADAARAASALHQAGMAHRDIQPTNVWLYPEGGKLADLGLAQVLEQSTVTGLGQIGSVEFMDPDILRGQSASQATDIWALGATLHWALTGHGLFGVLPPDEPLLGIRAVLSGAPTLASSLRPQDRAVVERCLAPPATRFATAADVAAAIDALPRA